MFGGKELPKNEPKEPANEKKPLFGSLTGSIATGTNNIFGSATAKPTAEKPLLFPPKQGGLFG